MKKQAFLLLNLVFLASNIQAQENVSCDCISYNGMNLGKGNHHTYTVSKEELTEVPPLSETWVNYTSDYRLEKDSLGRVSKLIRTNHKENSTQEITYIYDSSNKLIRENILFVSILKDGMRLLNYEQVDFRYDGQGRRVGKVRKEIYGPNEEIVVEECTYTY